MLNLGWHTKDPLSYKAVCKLQMECLVKTVEIATIKQLKRLINFFKESNTVSEEIFEVLAKSYIEMVQDKN